MPATAPLNLVPVNKTPAAHKIPATENPKAAIDKIDQIGSLRPLMRDKIGGVAILSPLRTAKIEATKRIG